MSEKKNRGRPRIRTAAYWREYYRQKQREWRAVHLYGCSPNCVTRVFDLVDRNARPNGRVRRAVSVTRVKQKSHNAAKRDGSL
jgi:hypothetical protein